MAASPICRRLDWYWVRRAASRADCTAENNSPINSPMTAITTNNSTNVKPPRRPMISTPALPGRRVGATPTTPAIGVDARHRHPDRFKMRPIEPARHRSLADRGSAEWLS